MLRLCALVLAAASCAAPARTSARIADVASGFASRPEAPRGAGPAPRARTNCVPSCEPGFRCNEDFARCERLPCMGQCQPPQWCDVSGPIERCVGETPPAL